MGRISCCLWAIAIFSSLKVLVASEVHDRWPHVNALSALSARLEAAESEVNATQAAMTYCVAELRAERDAFAKTRATVSSSEKDVLKGKDALQHAQARRAELRNMVKTSGLSKGVPTPITLQNEELEAISIFTQRVQQEAQELTDAKAKLAQEVKALRSHSGNKRSEVMAVKAELEQIENRTRVWETDKHALSEALSVHNQSEPQRLPSEKELDELRNLEQVVIPSVSSSIEAQEEIVATVMATLNATRSQLRACLESTKSSKQAVVAVAADRNAKKQVLQGVKKQDGQHVDDSETAAEQAAAADLVHILKDSSRKSDGEKEEDVEARLKDELSADEPYQPMVTVVPVAQQATVDLKAPGSAKGGEKSHDQKVEASHAPKVAAKSQGTSDTVAKMPIANKTSHMAKVHNASQSKSVDALKVALAIPRKMAESLRGKLEQSSPKPTLPSFGERVAGIMR